MDYTITKARYAKGKMAVRCPGKDGFKTRAGRVAECTARGRYTGREGAYIMSPSAAARFERLYAEGYDSASIFNYDLEPPRREMMA